jgi:hypothetical protein
VSCVKRRVVDVQNEEEQQLFRGRRTSSLNLATDVSEVRFQVRRGIAREWSG